MVVLYSTYSSIQVTYTVSHKVADRQRDFDKVKHCSSLKHICNLYTNLIERKPVLRSFFFIKFYPSNLYSMSSDPKSSATGSTKQDSWTTDHHLVGNNVRRSFICPNLPASGLPEVVYTFQEHAMSVARFHVDRPAERQPALWRSFLAQGTGDCNRSDNKKIPLYRAIDSVSNDWQNSTMPAVPSQEMRDIVKERITQNILQQVVQEYLQDMLVLAILEEFQTTVLQRMLKKQQQSAPDGAALSNSSMANEPTGMSRFPYYTSPPSVYLADDGDESQTVTIRSSNNTPDTTATVFPGTFTISQLVSRIKQGCGLVWGEYLRQYPGLSTQSTRGIALGRRSAAAAFDPDWKIQSGGMIARYLRERIIENQANSDWMTTANGSSVTEENDEETHLILGKGNPYLQPSDTAVLEWLGKMTAKYLSAGDLEGLVDLLRVHERTPSKKGKKGKVPLQEQKGTIGISLSPYFIGAVPNAIWAQVIGDSRLTWKGARLALKPKDPIAVDADRTVWSSCILWGESAARIRQASVAEEQRADQERKNEATSFGAWRYDAMVGGCTLWPSWMEGVKTKVNLFSVSESPTGTDPSTALAMELQKEEELAVPTRRSRRAEAGGGTGVFYGTQSTISHKQVRPDKPRDGLCWFPRISH